MIKLIGISILCGIAPLCNLHHFWLW